MSDELSETDRALPSSGLVLPADAMFSFAGPGAALLMRPDYLGQSAWTEHLPFAFWVVQALRPRVLVELGTHLGTSYFSFCQAVERFGTDTACYAVDTWQGDEHAGFYGKEVFATVSAYNQANFSGFSTLIRNKFEDALPYFSDGTIDLLHIDGCHGYEAVRADFESWLPKLSDRAVVMMHDTNVRERNFGVFRYFEELSEQYPCFEFRHGHGLGVVGVGRDLPGSVRELLAAASSAEKTRDIRRIFSRLGEDCQGRYQLDHFSSEKVRLEEALKRERGRAESLEKRLAAQQESAREQSQQHAQVVTGLRNEALAHSRKNDDLVHQAEDLAAQNRNLQNRLEEMERKHAAAVEKLRTEHAAEVSRYNEAMTRARVENERLMAELAARPENLAAAREDTQNPVKHVQRETLGKAAAESEARIQEVIRNATELVRVFAPNHPSSINVAISAGVRSLLKRIEAEEIVDGEWYLERNPDVRKSGMPPARHYALYGAAEMRLPRDLTRPASKK